MNRVAIVGGVRTPFVRAGGVFSEYSFVDLGIHSVVSLIKRYDLKPETVDELVYGSVLYDPRLPNFAREIVLRSDIPNTIGAHSVSNNCISSLVASNIIAEGISAGRIKTGIAGGSESMSRPTLTLKRSAEKFFIALSRARTVPDRLKLLASFRPGFIMPQPPSPKEPSTGLTMGQHCELTTKEFNIPRQVQDELALKSHKLAAMAKEKGYLSQEIEPLGRAKDDNVIRADTTIEKLSGLKPVFDRSDKGSLTAGNSSALTDGASAVLLMSEEEARKQNREILGFIAGTEYAALSPDDGLLMAPAVALPKLMKKHDLTVADIDRFEVHEAFAAQLAANLQAWENGWDKVKGAEAIGKIPDEKLNVNGGSVAIGHPFAATGGRLILSLVNELKRSNLSTGVISVCAAGGMACAMLIKRE